VRPNPSSRRRRVTSAADDVVIDGSPDCLYVCTFVRLTVRWTTVLEGLSFLEPGRHLFACVTKVCAADVITAAKPFDRIVVPSTIRTGSGYRPLPRRRCL
jgi:hypothetical protein